MLNTRSIKSKIQSADGKRISIMSRHTLSDGVTPDPEIFQELYDEWWPELSPPGLLIGSYYKRGLAWSEFKEQYVDYLRQQNVAAKIADLIDLANNGVVTVLCVEDQPEQCHRRLLAEECLLLEPGLIVNIH